jgi:predicted nuclease with TOPRIM domain
MQLPDKSASEIVEKLKYLMAENNSLVARLDESLAVITSRDKEIEILLQMLFEANETRSLLEHRLTEFQQLQTQVKELKKLIALSAAQNM